MNIPYSSFEYQYRDGGNSKSWDFVLLEGKANSETIEHIMSCLIDRIWFAAEQIGLPLLFNGLKWGQSKHDVSSHEFIELRPATDKEIKTIPFFGTLADLLQPFQKQKTLGSSDLFLLVCRNELHNRYCLSRQSH